MEIVGSVARAVIGSAVWLGGCGGAETIQLDFATAASEGARSMILAFDELPIEAEAYDALLAIDLEDAETPLRLPTIASLGPEVGAEASAIYLRATLELLGIEPGPIVAPSFEGWTTLGAIAAQSLVYAETQRLEPGEVEVQRGRFTAAEALPARLAETRIDPGCARFRAINGHVNTCRNLAFATRLGPAQFMFGSRCQRFFLATVAGERVSVEEIDSPLGGRAPEATEAQCSLEGRKPDTPGFQPKSPAIHSAHSDGAGNMAFGGLGRVYLGALGEELQAIELPELQAEVGEDAGVFWLTGNPRFSDPSFELFALSAKGRVLRITREADEPRVETLHDFAFATAEDETFGGIASSGPGHLVAVAPRDTRVLLYQQGELRLIPGASGFASATFVPGLGVLLGAEGGRIHRVEDDGTLYDYEPPPGWSSRVEGLGAFRKGFLFGGTNGYLGEHSPNRGFCETRQLTAAGARALFAVGPAGAEDRVFVVTGKEQSRDRNAYGLLIPSLLE